VNEREQHIRVDRPRCPFCRDDLLTDQEKTGCSACMAWHHTECWRSHGACSACGEKGSGPGTAPELDPVGVAEVAALKRRGQRTQAIQRYRDLAGCDLKTANEAVDALDAPAPRTRAGLPRLDPELERALRADQKIAAIQRYRELYGGDLSTAKAGVEDLQAKLGLGDSGECGEAALAIGFAAVVAGAIVAVLIASMT